MNAGAPVEISRRNNGAYRRECARCHRSASMVVRIVASGDDWIVAEVECTECGVDSSAIIGERGDRARALRDTGRLRLAYALDGEAAP